jgi:uncharacterized protein (DUF697 family)
MSKLTQIAGSWSTIKEIDLRPLRQQALRGVRIALVGAPGSGRHTLADQMRRDPVHPQMEAADTPVLILDIEAAGQNIGADLTIIVVDTRNPEIQREKNYAISLANAGKKVLVFANFFDTAGVSQAISPQPEWGKRRIVWGSALDSRFLLDKFAPLVIDLLPEHLLGLGRFFPLFRVPVAHYLINDTCISNASYSLSTGLAETIAVLDIPLVIADSIILTKSQAFLAYKLGLTLGFSLNWQDYLAEFGGVLGAGFLWREIARTLIGLVPVYGIIPKVAISYAGTYIVGTAILQWYMTGRHVSKGQVRQLYAQALARGKHFAQNLVAHLPHPRLGRPRLPHPALPRRKTKALPPQAPLICGQCGKPASAPDARFCQYCAAPLAQATSTESAQPAEQAPAADQTEDLAES